MEQNGRYTSNSKGIVTLPADTDPEQFKRIKRDVVIASIIDRLTHSSKLRLAIGEIVDATANGGRGSVKIQFTKDLYIEKVFVDKEIV